MNFLSHFIAQHLRIATGHPDFKGMKDSYDISMLYAGGASFAACVFFVTATNVFGELLPVEACLVALLVACLPFAMNLLLTFFYSGNHSLLSAFYGASTVVDLAATALSFGGLQLSDAYPYCIAVKAVLWGAAVLEFSRQDEAVRAKGYGLKEGEF